MPLRTNAFSLLLSLLLPATVLAAPPKPTVWIGPPGRDNGRALRELFEHPDEWKETRSLVDGLFYTDLQFQKQFTDEELGKWLPMLAQWNIKLGLETGVVKEWSLSGEKTFHIERKIWDRLERLGGKIRSIAMDEPLCAVREHIHKPDDLALQETANYIALIRQNYPDIEVGDIETYPSIALEDHVKWIDDLNGLLAQKKVRGLDFYRLDVNWIVFDVQGHGNWKEVKKLETECRKRKLPFSLIYWPSGYPPLEKRGLATDMAWYTPIMTQGYIYAIVDGHPDQYVIESWVGAPAHIIPETQEFTFTRTIRDFVHTFVQPPAK
jgi:hypothetical protein